MWYAGFAALAMLGLLLIGFWAYSAANRFLDKYVEDYTEGIKNRFKR